MAQFTANGLTFTYPGREAPALKNISLSIERGQFIALVGPSGCGKTTLLRHLKPALIPHGRRIGEVMYRGMPVAGLGQRAQSEKIGFVMQSPENQIVTDKVWHELAFGLESLGCSTPEIRMRVAEMASFFGIQDWFYKSVTELSGGQKQLLSLASIMVLQPEALILDEPTSQLDPIAAADFLAAVGKINRELGVTVIMTEHRLEEVFPMADRVICMDKGEIICDGAPSEVGAELRGRGHTMFLAMPAPMRIYAAVKSDLPCPITVRDGRAWLDKITAGRAIDTHVPVSSEAPKSEAVIELSDVWFRYDKQLLDVVKGLSLKVSKGEFLCILGGNGTGKTTALTLISGINKPHRGAVRLFGESIDKIGGARLWGGMLGVLPQNPQSLFVKKTVYEDLLEIFAGTKIDANEKERLVRSVSAFCQIDKLLSVHPYDLSGGEQQRAALAKVLLLKPQILLLDEPTKGLDAEFKQKFAAILRGLGKQGVTIVMVSHDVEFCAEHASRCAMFFDGNIVSEQPPHEFFTGNSFYTTSANRMARHLLHGAVTAGDVIAVLGGETPPRMEIDTPYGAGFSDGQSLPSPPVANERKKLAQRVKTLSKMKKVAFFIVLALFFATIALIGADIAGFKTFVSGGGAAPSLSESEGIWRYLALLLSLCVEAAVMSGMLYSEKGSQIQTPVEKRKLSRRTLAMSMMVLVAIPLTIYFGMYFLGDRKYYFISMLIILETMLPFALIFESRKPQARELVIISVLCALGVAGRAAFFMLPQFKPVVAIVIISGVAFGGETGFLVGAVTAFVSNIYFMQGPWTPWQMFAFGIIGFLAGVLFRKGLLRRGRVPLCVFGGLATFIIYGIIMDTSTVFTYQDNVSFPMLLAAYMQGIPFNLVHAAATVIFLWIASGPILEKLDRIKFKYGLVE